MKRIALIKAREEKTPKETQKQAAKNIGISEIYLRKLEAGNESPGRKALIKIESYYGISMRMLFPDIFLPNSDSNPVINT